MLGAISLPSTSTYLTKTVPFLTLVSKSSSLLVVVLPNDVSVSKSLVIVSESISI